ncbi:MAG: hypothetical protein H6811_07045 [Phycisphaeraceae bacterium]|nr:hypothetical protein [Phycisphaeraceae bacterium]
MLGLLRLVSVMVAGVLAGLEPPTTGISSEEPSPDVLDTGLPAQPASAEAQAHDLEFTTADNLLAALEQVGSDIRTLRAPIRQVKVFAFEGDEQVRTGTLYYQNQPGEGDESGAVRKFAVEFETLEFGSRIERDDQRTYVFDGEWLVEKLHRDKQFFKRQVVPPGQSFDPLRIGEGPFPIPIGQKREDILERFEAELWDPQRGLAEIDPVLESWVASKPTYQLRLAPRPEYAEDFDLVEIRLWYLRDGLLPRMAWTRNRDGNETVVQLLGSALNGPLPERAMDTSTPSRGWDVEITPWRGHIEDER